LGEIRNFATSSRVAPSGGAAWLLVGLVFAFGCNAADGPINVLLISLDTVRSAELGVYGSGLPTSPSLDALAAEGVVFENAFATSPWTLPSHASLLTGLYPNRNGMRAARSVMPDWIASLPELLAAGGHGTAAAVNSHYLDRKRGFARGFEQFEHFHPRRRRENPLEVAETVLAWLRAMPPEPFFYFWHEYTAHSDYTALPEYLAPFEKPYDGVLDGTTKQLKQVREGAIEVDDDDVRHLLNLYRAGVRQVDAQVGRVIEELRSSGRLDRTLVVVVSDHGEEFLEHGGVLHGQTQYEEVLRIPLLMRGPGIPPGRRIHQPVSLVDVVPTVLALLGMDGPHDLDGRDLSPLFSETASGNWPERALFGGAGHNTPGREPLRSVRRGRYKLIHDPSRQQFELFDLQADPAERSDRAAALPDVTSGLRADLESHWSQPVAAELLPQLSPEERAALEALGYVP
jgi:arylsulfatase A-like enzyme